MTKESETEDNDVGSAGRRDDEIDNVDIRGLGNRGRTVEWP
jgi:hypothetical protein